MVSRKIGKIINSFAMQKTEKAAKKIRKYGTQ
jgi:hypothetical protein